MQGCRDAGRTMILLPFREDSVARRQRTNGERAPEKRDPGPGGVGARARTPPT
jgi:hypothetical protein